MNQLNDFNAQVDLIGINGGQGEVAGRFFEMGAINVGMMRPYINPDGRSYITVFRGGDKGDIRNYSQIPLRSNNPLQVNATLRRDEWKTLDEAILEVARTRLPGVNGLISRGLTYDLGDGMGTTILETHTVSDSMEAEMTMDGVTRGQGDRPDFQHVYMPIPIIHVDYEINMRVLANSRKLGNPLDATSAEHAARKVAEKLESLTFTNTSYAYGGGTIYSLLNHPQRNTGSLTANWDDSAIEGGANIVADVRAMKQASINDRHYGPWVLYIPTNYETVMDDDYDSTTPGTTIRERILKIGGIEDVQVIDTMPADNVELVEMNKETVRIVRGMAMQNIQWSTEGGMVNKFKVLIIQVPQVRADQEGHSGIVHYT